MVEKASITAEKLGIGAALVGIGFEIFRKPKIAYELIGAGVGLFVLGAIGETIAAHKNHNNNPPNKSW